MRIYYLPTPKLVQKNKYTGTDLGHARFMKLEFLNKSQKNFDTYFVVVTPLFLLRGDTESSSSSELQRPLCCHYVPSFLSFSPPKLVVSEVPGGRPVVPPPMVRRPHRGCRDEMIKLSSFKHGRLRDCLRLICSP